MSSGLYDRAREKFLVITINHPNAGLFAYVNFVLNQLIYAERHSLRPVVYFGPQSGHGPNAYYDASAGDNMWDYYFEPVANISYANVKDRLADAADPLCPDDLVALSVDDLWRIHEHEPDSIFPFPHGIHFDTYKADAEWYPKQRRRARELIRKYIRIRPHVLSKVDAFERDYFDGKRILGVHLRGTDKGTAKLPPALMRIVKPVEYFPYIDRYISAHRFCKIFVATDQQQFLEEMRARYGDRILSYDAVRASGLRNSFHLHGDGYRKGEDVLIDCLLLSRSNFLLKCTSAVGEFAMYFNPDLECIDLNHQNGDLSRMDLLSVQLRNKAWDCYHRVSYVKQSEGASWLKAWLTYLLR